MREKRMTEPSSKWYRRGKKHRRHLNEIIEKWPSHTQETCAHFPALPSSIVSAHKATLQWWSYVRETFSLKTATGKQNIVLFFKKQEFLYLVLKGFAVLMDLYYRNDWFATVLLLYCVDWRSLDYERLYCVKSSQRLTGACEWMESFH